MDVSHISTIFEDVARILELKGDNPFKVRAYQRAARTIEGLGDELESLIKDDRLTDLDGIGNDLAEKIKEIVLSGRLRYYEELQNTIPAGLLAMMDIPGLGPKTVKLLYDQLGIDSVKKLQLAAKAGRLKALEGIKEKTEKNILKGIAIVRLGQERTPYPFIYPLAEGFLRELKSLKAVEKIELAGSIRRRKDTIKDIDILAVSHDAPAVTDAFTALPGVRQVLARGRTKSSVRAGEFNTQVDLRVVEKDSFGAALMYFTGSKEFNVAMRRLAIKKGYKLNEYGLFDKKGKRLAGSREEEIFSLLGLTFIPPELREDRGEIAAATRGSLPRLIKFSDIAGDLHVHSDYSDGAVSLSGIAEIALARGYRYIGITDHSQSLKVAKGLDQSALLKKRDAIARLNEQHKSLRILFGTEVEIMADGSLDYCDDILKEFDLVVAAVHSSFKQSRTQMTKRVVSACRNKYVNILAHPTAKLWGTRDSVDIDMDELLRVCRDTRVAMEMNCNGQRMDLNDAGAMQAKKMAVKLAINTDSHKPADFDRMAAGVYLARRAWLHPQDVINCLSYDELKKWLKK